MSENLNLADIWRHSKIPIVFRRSRPLTILVKLPYQKDNYEWLRNEEARKPEWNSQYKSWEVPQAWFERVTKLCLSRYKKCHVIQLRRETSICASKCWEAQGLHCECSCLGEMHGGGAPGGRWYELSETFAILYGVQKYSVRLLKSKKTIEH